MRTVAENIALPSEQAKSTTCGPAYGHPTTVKLIAQLGLSGAHVATVVETMHHREGEAAVRRIMGIRSLLKKHGSAAVDHACKAILEMGLADYRPVRRFLEHHAPPLSLAQVDPLIRQLTHYRDLINQKTEGDTP